MSDKTDKIDRMPLVDLAIEEHRLKLIKQHDKLALNELRNMLKRQTEQEIAVEELRGVIDTLAEGMVATITEVQTLKRTVGTLERTLKEVHEKQDKLAELCDHLAASAEAAIDRR